MNDSLKQTFKGGLPKEKDVFLHVEDTQNGKTYAITLGPKSQPDFRSPNGLTDWLGEQRAFLKSLKGADFRLYIETSKTGRLHFHGYIMITNRVLFAIRSVPQLMSFYSTVIKDMLTMDDYINWMVYCTKIQNDMTDYLCSEILSPIKKYELSDLFYTIST